ncbi:MAG: hypothetical protein R3208_11180 [Ketobacteraceae bacterium]|nr:hypothetical protein [Ketobacteraceae bacterium]
MMGIRITGLVALVVLALLPGHTDARSFRDFNAIPTPEALPDNAKLVEDIRFLDRELVERGVNHILGAWNRGELAPVLAEDFMDAQKLADTILTTVPRDARLSLESLGGYNVLRQYRIEDPDSGNYRVSRVAVIVRLQLTFNDPRTGYQRLPSTSEFILDIREPI